MLLLAGFGLLRTPVQSNPGTSVREAGKNRPPPAERLGEAGDRNSPPGVSPSAGSLLHCHPHVGVSFRNPSHRKPVSAGTGRQLMSPEKRRLGSS